MEVGSLSQRSNKNEKGKAGILVFPFSFLILYSSFHHQPSTLPNSLHNPYSLSSAPADRLICLNGPISLMLIFSNADSSVATNIPKQFPTILVYLRLLSYICFNLNNHETDSIRSCAFSCLLFFSVIFFLLQATIVRLPNPFKCSYYC